MVQRVLLEAGQRNKPGILTFLTTETGGLWTPFHCQTGWSLGASNDAADGTADETAVLTVNRMVKEVAGWTGTTPTGLAFNNVCAVGDSKERIPCNFCSSHC